jgi:hypothetical protein
MVSQEAGGHRLPDAVVADQVDPAEFGLAAFDQKGTPAGQPTRVDVGVSGPAGRAVPRNPWSRPGPPRTSPDLSGAAGRNAG